ncbi:MAG: DNRLRE domain-containing protein [Spirochaetaceae bacterium]|nr:DNRLRE domain-containing protein [Myxococcales bacterium]MCB9723300.1 DNRLRE domain-containing protein [Spirochaetaceae bacterium]
MPSPRMLHAAIRRLRLLALLIATALASAGSVQGDTIVMQASEDTAPYSFLPSLPRHTSPTLYAFRSLDEQNVEHDFETYLWFDVAEEDLPPGHVLVQALLVNTYAFDFTGFGDPSSDPGTIECREVLEPWTQTSLTWSNRPEYDAPFDSVTGITGFGAMICDATAVVFDWIHGVHPNEGFALTNPGERVIGMHSLESGQPGALLPTLILTTELPEPGLGLALGVGVFGLVLSGWMRRERGRAGADR